MDLTGCIRCGWPVNLNEELCEECADLDPARDDAEGRE